jgi:hypothetical protein
MQRTFIHNSFHNYDLQIQDPVHALPDGAWTEVRATAPKLSKCGTLVSLDASEMQAMVRLG